MRRADDRQIARRLTGGVALLFALAALVCTCAAQQVIAPPPMSGAPGPTQELIAEVRLVGNETIPEARIMQHIRTRAGRPFDLETVEKDVRALNKTRMFVSVRPLEERRPDGVVVIFQLVERPTVRHLQYVGNKRIKRKTLDKQIGIRVGDAMDPFSVEEGRRRLEDYYREKGFSKIRIEIHEGTQPGDRGVVFEINEGPRRRVRWTSFVGNSIANDARLRTQIKSKPPIAWVIGGYYDDEQVAADLERLTAYYRSLGFFRAVVGREVVFTDGGDWADVTFVINEGPRYRVRNMSFIGNSELTQELLAADLNIASGDYFDQGALNRDLARIRDEYGSRGYIFADVQAEPRFLEEPGTLDLVYDIEEGKRWRVGNINVHIAGDHPHTKITTVLNRMGIAPGEIVDIRKIRDAERRLKASGLFVTNPTQGSPPKITFAPPELGEDKTQIAGRRPGVRGQSPDAPHTHTAQRPAPRQRPTAPQAGGNDRWLNLNVTGTPVAPDRALGPDQDAPNSELPSPHAGAGPAVAPAPWNLPPAPRQQHIASEDQALPAPRGKVVRGQSPGSGRFIPNPDPLPVQSPPAVNGYPYNTGAGVQNVPQVQIQPMAPGMPQYSTVPPQQNYNVVPAPNTVTPPANNFGGAGYPAANAYGPPANPVQQNVNPLGPNYVPPRYVPPPRPGAMMFAPPPGGVGQPFPQGGAATSDEIFPGAGSGFFEPTIDIDAFAEEAQTGRLQFGVGINSDAGLVGNIILDEQNFDLFRWPTSLAEIRDGTAFRGAGQQFRIEAVPGTELQRYMINFREPYLFDSLVQLGVSGFYFTRRFRDWDEQRLGGRLALGYQFSPDLSGTVFVRGEQVNISNVALPTPPDLMDVVGDNDLYIGGVTLAHNTRDNNFLPTEGHMIELTLEHGFGTFEFPRANLEGSRHFLIRQRPDGSGRHVLNLNGRLGFAGSETPIFEHYFAGGFSTLRGFDFRGASPQQLGVFVGGEFLALGSVEYLFPLIANDMLHGVVFCDFGTVEDNVALDADNFRVAPGVGLRISIAALGPAPIALDFAVPVAHADGDDIRNFSFFVGFGR